MLPPVKALVFLLLLALPAPAASADPNEAALAFLEKVRTGKLNLEPDGDTALSANTQEHKRLEITRRLERTALDLETGTLEAAESKTDGDLAAVVIRKTGGFDPARLRVCAVALVRKNGLWCPAPVPASFENTGIGFAPEIRRRARTLEDWMLDRQASVLGLLRQQVTEHMRTEILASLSLDQLRAMSADEAGRTFIEACAKPRLPAMLALLGGLQPNLPDDWSSRLQYANAAADAPQSASLPWRLLVAPDVVRVIVHQESDETTGQLSLACIDPAGTKSRALPNIKFIHLELEKSTTGLWQVNPPQSFLEPPDARTRKPWAEHQGDDDDDDDLLDELPARLRASHPLLPQATFPAALTALQDALEAPTPLPLLALLDLTGPVKTARTGCLKAIALWSWLHDSAAVRHPVLLDSVAHETTAAAAFQFFAVPQDGFDLRMFYFERGDDGWHLLSGLALDDLCQDRFAAVTRWVAAETDGWTGTWRGKVLADAPAIIPSDKTPPPSAADTRKLLDDWFEAIDSGDFSAALKLCARLDSKDSSSRLLRNLGYEINSARKSKVRPTVIGIAPGRFWTAATVRTNQAENPATACYPVISTPAGPRLLLEADLFISSDRSRKFLNNASFEHLRDAAPAAAADLQQLFDRLAKNPSPE